MARKSKRIVRYLATLTARMWMRYRRDVHKACGRVALGQIRQKGKGCRVLGPIDVIHRKNLWLGDRVRIGSGCYLFCYGGLKIGDNTSISRYVTVYTANHNTEGSALPYDTSYRAKPVVIGRHVWIGMHVCITPGVTIGDGAVIGMGAVVSKDIPPGAIVVGAPTRIVRHRDMEHFARLDQEGRFLDNTNGFEKPPTIDLATLGSSGSDRGPEDR